jgi:hypothetical protein
VKGARLAAAILAGLLVCAHTISPRSASDAADSKRARLDLSIDTPEPGSVIGDPMGMAFVAGRALALYGEYQTFDIMFAIDTSESTSAPSGADIDDDGTVGRPRGGPFLSTLGRILLGITDRDDTVLAAEIAAAESLLIQLDPRTTRVGVVVFSGDSDPMTPDAYAEVALTTDYDKVRRGLRRVGDRGPEGMTNMVSGLNTAIIELLGTQSAYSDRREGARRIILFLTDGYPTLPFEHSRRLNARAAIERAKRAKRARIRIDTFAIGEEALDEPISAVEMARVTGGVFTPVRHPRDLRAIFEEVTFAEIERLEIKNRTTGKPASYLIQNADGSFSSLVPMREGSNTVEVRAWWASEIACSRTGCSTSSAGAWRSRRRGTRRFAESSVWRSRRNAGPRCRGRPRRESAFRSRSRTEQLPAAALAPPAYA